MNLKQFNKLTNEERKKLLEGLTESAGWDLFKFWVQYEEIESIELAIINGSTDQTIEDIKVLRENLKFATGVINKPYELIENLKTEISQSELPPTE